jgi:hypothetical protein
MRANVDGAGLRAGLAMLVAPGCCFFFLFFFMVLMCAAGPVSAADTSDAPDAGGPRRQDVIKAAPAAAPDAVQAAARPPELGRWLADTFGEGKPRNTFVPELRRLLTQIRQRLAALRALATRYPASDADAAPESAPGPASSSTAAVATRVASASATDAPEPAPRMRRVALTAGPAMQPASRQRPGPAARTRLDRQVRLLYTALRNDLDALDARFAVLFGSTARGLPASEVPADWRRRTEVAAGYAASLESLVKTLLDTRDDLATGDPDGTEERTARTFAALWDAINAPTQSASVNP